MRLAVGDPDALHVQSGSLNSVADDLTNAASDIAVAGKSAAGACGDADVAAAVQRSTAAVGGALAAMSAITTGLGRGARTAGDQLLLATGGR